MTGPRNPRTQVPQAVDAPVLTVAVLQQKGGSGKTTLAVNLAAAHLEGRRTLVVDMDRQASAFDWSAARQEGSSLEGLSVVKADRAIARPRFREISRGYEIVFLDGPPRLGDVTQSAAVAADVAVLPLQPHARGLPRSGRPVARPLKARARAREHRRQRMARRPRRTEGTVMNTPEEAIIRDLLDVLALGSRYTAAVHQLHESLRTPQIAAEVARREHAAAYDETAKVYRRRAEKAEAADRAELERRAAYYEARARVKREGALMPRELRTPAERLASVDLVRQSLLRLLALLGDVDTEDVEAFEAAIVDPHGELPPRAGSSADQFLFLKSVIHGVLVRMGCLFDETGRGVRVLKWALEIVEGQGVSFSPGTGVPMVPSTLVEGPGEAVPVPSTTESMEAITPPTGEARLSLSGGITFTPGPGPNADPLRVIFTPGNASKAPNGSSA